MTLVVPNGFERNFTLGFVRGLAANGVDALVLSDDDTAPALDAADIAHVNVRGSVSENRPGWRKAVNLLRYYAALFARAWRHRGEVIHFTGMFQNGRVLFEGLALNLALRLAAGRYLYTVHNVLPHGREGSRFFRWVYRWIYRMPHRLLVHTRRAGQQLVEEFGVPPEKIQHTSIGLNEEMPVTALTPADARRQLGLEPDERVVLFFGKIDAYKGLDLLLDAFDQLNAPGPRLVIAGVFRAADYRETILRRIAALRRRDRVQLHEHFVPNDEAEVFFKAGDVLCLPYRQIYQSGLVFLGPRFGIPLVTTDVGSLRESVEEDGLGLVSRTNDAAGLTTALDEFFARPDRFRRATITAAVQRHRWETVCRELIPLYTPPRTGQQANPVDGAAASFSPPQAGSHRP